MARQVKRILWFVSALVASAFLSIAVYEKSFALDYANTSAKWYNGISYGITTQPVATHWYYPNLTIQQPLRSGAYENRLFNLTFNTNNNFTVQEGMVATFSLVSQTQMTFTTGQLVTQDYGYYLNAGFQCPTTRDNADFIITSCEIEQSTSESFPNGYENFNITSTLTLSIYVNRSGTYNSIPFEDIFFTWTADGSPGPSVTTTFQVPNMTFVVSPQTVINDINQSIKDNQDKQDQQREEDKKAGEDAANQGTEASDNAQSEVDDASSSLLDVLTSFLGVITSAFNSSGSCNLSLDFGFFDGGAQNLCSGLGHFQGIVSPILAVVMVGVIIGLVIAIIKNFMALFNLLFGGS